MDATTKAKNEDKEPWQEQAHGSLPDSQLKGGTSKQGQPKKIF